ncbi:MAG TPA: hypothetical protein VMT93_04355 [Gemmatimonadaceae bacterium]|nr:hypothetical protein [Gemmatimonadaceae bacterium]
MPRYLVEVSHDATTAACNQAIAAFLRTGSQYLSRADWGCKDGEHKAWMIVELPSKGDALQIVPPELRARARVVQLTAFTMDQDRIRAVGGHE